MSSLNPCHFVPFFATAAHLIVPACIASGLEPMPENAFVKTVLVDGGSESAGVDIQLAGIPFVRVSGKVVGMPRGAPEPYVTISSHDMGGYGDPVRPDGSFEFWGLDPGHYRLIADWGAPGGQETTRGRRTSTAVIEIEVAESNVDNIELRVVPDSDIAGRVELDAQEISQQGPKGMVFAENPNGPENTTLTPRFGISTVAASVKVPAKNKAHDCSITAIAPVYLYAVSALGEYVNEMLSPL
jgi:hypothetical protein